MKQLTMTKVLTPLAALAFAFGVQAAVPSVDGFETYAENASVTNATGWSFEAGSDGADDASFVTTYTTAGIATPATCPDGQTAGSNFLKLSTEDGKLFRNMDGDSGQFVQLDAGLYVDTDVQFTITDPSDRPEVTADDKFIIWLEDQGASGTNLCVWARKFTNMAATAFTSNVYTLVASDGSALNITPGAWYRLTVKALSSVGTGVTFPAFQVYLNDSPLKAYSGQYITTLENGEGEGEDYFDQFATSVGGTIVTDRFYFPAMANSLSSLSKVGFSGEGAIDNVVVTKEVPGFEDPTTLTFDFDDSVIDSIDITSLGASSLADGATLRVAPGTTFTMDINWKTGYSTSTHTLTTTTSSDAYATVSDLSVTTVAYGAATIGLVTTAKDTVDVTFSYGALLDAVGNDCDGITFAYGTETVPANIERARSTTIQNLKVGTNITVTVSYTGGNWVTVITPAACMSKDGTTLTINSRPESGTATVTLTASAPVATVNGQPYGSLAEVLTAANAAGTATIGLAVDANLSEVAIASGKDITIDLAGHDITCTNENAAAVFTVADGGTLTITNSTPEDVGIVSKGTAAACISNAGTLNLQAGKFDIANGAISGGTINVTGGAYNANTFAGANLGDKILVQDTGAQDAYAYVLGDAPVAQVVGDTTYTTLKAAIDAASAGATVVVLKDCEVTEPITFTRGITVSNDFTVTVANNGSITYAYRVINGTSTPVTLCGTGTFTESGSPSGSQFLVGFTVTRYETDPTAGSLVLDGCTVTNGQSNVIKVENGTFTMNSGTINAAGLRGVKADGEDSANSATVTINGGAINSTKAAVAVSSKADKGEATATINGGTIAGPVTDEASAVALSSITIPSTSTARFDRDQTTFCATGYATTLNDGWYTVGLATYTISYLKEDGSAFTDWATSYTAPATYTMTDAVTLPTSSDVDLQVVGVSFGGWTNDTGTVTGWAAGQTGNVTVYAKLDPVVAPVGWVDDPNTITEGTTAGEQYSALASTDLANADAKKLTVWAKANSVAFSDATTDAGDYVEAFLLNCAPTSEAVAAAKAAFKLSITVSGSTVTVSLPDGQTYNGTLQMKGSNDLSTWTNVESASSSYKFYKYSLSL